MLLSGRYMRALKVLEQGDREAVDPKRRLNLVKTALQQQLLTKGVPAQQVRAFTEEMPDRYFLITPEGDLPLHFELMRRLEDRHLMCQHRHFPIREFSEFVVVTRDQRGLFSRIAGVLTANNLHILSARITTRTNGTVLDVFRVSHQSGGAAMAMEEDRWERIERDLTQVVAGEQ